MSLDHTTIGQADVLSWTDRYSGMLKPVASALSSEERGIRGKYQTKNRETLSEVSAVCGERHRVGLGLVFAPLVEHLDFEQEAVEYHLKIRGILVQKSSPQYGVDESEICSQLLEIANSDTAARYSIAHPILLYAVIQPLPAHDRPYDLRELPTLFQDLGSAIVFGVTEIFIGSRPNSPATRFCKRG
jgi:hypothetical protein